MWTKTIKDINMSRPLKYDYIENDPTRKFADINISFTKHPITGDVSIKTDDDAIKQGLRNLVLLNYNEKPFHYEIGGDIYNILFDNIEDPGNEESVRYVLSALINQYEPRVELQGIDVDFLLDKNAMEISIYYIILNTLQPSNVTIFLKNVR